MTDFRITLPRNPLMTAPRDDTSRRGETAAPARAERTSFDATLQRTAAREPSGARPNDASGTRPATPPARDAGTTTERPTASPSTPSAAPARTMKPDDSHRATRSPADAGSDAPTDTITDDPTGPIASAIATAMAVAAADAGAAETSAASDPLPPDLIWTGSAALPAADAPTPAEAESAAASLPASDASVTAGLIAASMAIGSAAARASATPMVAEEDADHGEPALASAELADTSGKSASAASVKRGGADADAAPPAALTELSAELTRTPARDRLMQDFEQRFENSLARAVGAPGGGVAGGASPLLLAGLPPQPLPAQASTPVAHASIASPLSHPAFGDDLAHRVLLFAGQRVQSAEISLTPADLGPIRVSLELRGQEASVQFNAAHAATRSAIEDALPRLREMLAAQGLQLAQADVGDRAPRDPQGGRGGDDARPQSGAADARTAPRGASLDASAAGAISGRRVGLIDVRV